ncbi:bifunctional polynucleotide phosphatase/kinase, putative [Plasmodium vivax]|uniref:Bifunctional polynucleotide phosphatase/kinase, putative n=4 Tax=Plasmodium vivax TaxID=5855 RepID=A5K2N7_PLAVS|nr:bifunctional polynucleotide phosphatase/kinase, putative [Plasmodium vivax]KMZ85940.1 bifunctional polynucleotide phosphatase/kinase [Plasmodium vivax Brazil I]KMZ98842.1 bifunctional polynucleotide phosphatase/kinase [Plasmodium vivax North Korean]EDL46687.1 bifunctional polynucleotide phosphatase/kinase, putative [Plasmodium vivax]SCO67991.1 bifunctional polynucleotide phosphatase/kinase, putative [Plasmodium vivax]SCO73455.1 bifunctional polynucleotide phosphatase/kinase, putative [Plasm|eukprot:XP_001616414.1 bifunctional polynucleotide phosphatase/kinase [Plasmodium vivax Sal-1]
MRKRPLSHFELPNDKWKLVDDSLLYRIVQDAEDKAYKKVFSFDLDNTLILSRSFFKPAQNEHDYIFYADVIDFLKKKKTENYKIIIFSNQKGVSTGKISLLNIVNRVDDVIEKIGIPLECYLALKNDKYRKPRIGMYKFAMQNNKAKIDEIIYVGDNANRIYDDNFKTKFINHLKSVYSQNKVSINIGEIAKRLKKDYTDTDLKFALNINATFYTPEELFLNIKNNLTAEFSFNPSSLLKKVGDKPNEQDAQGDLRRLVRPDLQSGGEQNEATSPQSGTQNEASPPQNEAASPQNEAASPQNETASPQNEAAPPQTNLQHLVLLVGPPGCGKTSLCKNHFADFAHINLEELKTKNKRIETIRQAITSGKNVVMDNANMYVKNRLIYITEAKKINANLNVSAIFFNYSKELVFHLNNFKLIADDENRMHEVPTIAIHSFYKYVEVPSESENLDRVVTLHDEHFVPSDFQNEERRKLFFSYLY